ncbi:hypothetical protein BGX38DRAFT_1142911 [Terfezia claveryi]|nr:hypothetical protein BGX38DRAFT_1142911 [Terfezia claveryi]
MSWERKHRPSPGKPHRYQVHQGEREKEPAELEGGRGSVHGSEFMQPELMNIQRRPDLMNVDVGGEREIGVDQLASITESLRTGVPNSAQVQQLQIQESPRTVLPSAHYNPYMPADQGLIQRCFTRADTITRGPEQLVLEGERTANQRASITIQLTGEAY